MNGGANGQALRSGSSFSGDSAVVTLYFCLDDNAPVMRVWPVVPRIADTVILPEFGGHLGPLKVVDVVYEGFDEPSISVYLTSARREHSGSGQLSAENGQEAESIAR